MAMTADSGGRDVGGSSNLGQALGREEVGCVPDPTSLVRLTQDPAMWANPMLSQGVRLGRWQDRRPRAQRTGGLL